MAEFDDILKPVNVVYCGKCSMPLEFCEYGPDFETHCVPWMKKNHPDVLKQILKDIKGVDDSVEKEGEAEGPSKPAEPWTAEERLTAFYEMYQPDKLADIPNLLTKYAGKEDKLFIALTKKYGPEPEDPYYAESDEEGDLDEDMENLNISGKNKRGAKAKVAKQVETRVVIQKTVRNKKKATTIIVGMDTVPGIKLKDVSKTFSKRFAGSSSVKDGPKGKEIIIQGDHMEDVAEMIVSKFKVAGSSVFLDMNGDFLPYS
ncbi:unnamed protein product [Cylindrotheca closterium]|uniref:SUI1 domain-containing protein n=1 Tax=Cylindrotheca closterium TaxID=2856 RepID=A0AAD2CSP4_9STRA|nr:unnamed protein product [Cylindrotheca closterium]